MVTPSSDEPGDELRGDRDHVALRVRVSTWTKSRRRMLANGREVDELVVGGGVVDARDAADRDAAAGTAT